MKKKTENSATLVRVIALIKPYLWLLCLSLLFAVITVVTTLYAPVLNIDVRSTVGAGDSMVAGLVSGCMGEYDLEDTFRMGVACATARCMTEGHKVVDKTIYKALLDMVRIEKL